MTPAPDRRDEDASRDVDETSEESFPASDPPPTWASAGETETPPEQDAEPASRVRDDGTLEDPPPIPPARRRRLVHRVTLWWGLVMLVAVALVATAVVGLAIGGDDQAGRTVVFTAAGLVGAALALIATIWRGKVGDDLDEAKL
ncbi:hypothetical protein [Aeromicrobium alkaliterrae]|uniref:Uncharacterized protein n=1 Tax=Aeromicrobium alkaliterrae TaxID=302168 RepID=A0ABN2K5S3_9ACTN